MSSTNLQEDTNINLKFILDPLSVIIKLAILSKKSIGSKICVFNNALHIQENGLFQPLVRYFYKNNKIDIQYLYNPIELACVNFLSKKNIEANPNIKNLFFNAQKGLEVLIETYKNFTIITHTLYFYSNIISNYLGSEHKINKNLFIKDNISTYYSPDLVTKLNSIWTEDRIKMILNMIDFIDKDKGSIKSVKCLEEFIIIIDNEIPKIIS